MSRRKKLVLLTTAEAAELLRLKPHTLENERSLEIGPPYRKHGWRVFYELEELLEWSRQTRRPRKP